MDFMDYMLLKSVNFSKILIILLRLNNDLNIASILYFFIIFTDNFENKGLIRVIKVTIKLQLIIEL